MKRWILLGLVLTLTMTAAAAMALTEEEWNKQCRWKTSQSTTVYVVASVTEAGPEEDYKRTYTFEPAGIIASGKYLGSRLHKLRAAFSVR